MIYTVFPNDKDASWSDFSSYEEAEEYGNEEYGEENYEIQSTSGEVV